MLFGLISTLGSVLGQMDDPPLILDFCQVTGFVIIPATFFAWFWLIRRRRRPESVGGAAVVFAVAVTSALFVLWMIGGIDEWLFEPKTDDVGAMVLLGHLPEVHEYLHARPAGGPPRDVRPEAVTGPQVPLHTMQLAVGEIDETGGKMKSVWRHFRVNLVNSNVSVLTDASVGRWIPLEQWRRSHPATQPGG